MTLTVDQQPQGGISGQFTVALPLQGNGPFTGNIDTQGNFRFLVTSRDTTAPILFSGDIQPDGSLSGSYCSVNSNNQCDTSAGGHGVWDAAKS